MLPAGILDLLFLIPPQEDSAKMESGPIKPRKFGDIVSYKELQLWDLISVIDHLNFPLNNVFKNVIKTMIALDLTTVLQIKIVG